MKKLTLGILSILTIFLLFQTNVKADMFEKPSADITVKGIEEDYKIEILIYKNYSVDVLNYQEIEDKITGEYYSEFPFDLLNGYQDDDGYASRILYSGKPARLDKLTTNTYRVGYYSAPSKFKIAIILADSIIITSKVVNRKLFNSKITFDLTGLDLTENQEDAGLVVEDYPVKDASWRFIVRVFGTIVVEIIILFLFMYRKSKSYIIVGITNFVTQTVLTLFMTLSYYLWASDFGLIFALLAGEALVFIIEIVLYRFILLEHQNKRAMLYGFVANLVTFLISVFTLWFI